MVEAWERIFQKTEGKNLFMRQVWFDAWSVYYNGSGVSSKVFYEHINVNNEHDAIIPYVYEKKGPLNLASLAGYYVPHCGIPNTGHNKELIDKVADRMLAKQDVSGFRLGYVKENDAFIIALTDELKRRKWRFIVMPFKYDYGKVLPKNEDEYYQSMSKNFRKNVAKGVRRLEEAGNVEFKYYRNESAETWQQVFLDMAMIEKNSWVGKRGVLRISGEQNQKFWNQLAADEWYSNAMIAIIVYLDGQPVCHYLSFDAGDTRYSYDTSYDEKVARCSAGTLLEVENNKHSISSGLKYVNSSFGSETAKIQLGYKKFAKHTSFILFPPTLRGNGVFLFVKLKHFVELIYIKTKLRSLKRKIFG